MRYVGVKLPDYIYEELVKRAKEGAVSLSELVRRAIEAYLGIATIPQVSAMDLKELVNRVEGLESELALLKEQVNQLCQPPVEKASESRANNVTVSGNKPRKTAFDFLKEQRFIVESELTRIRNRDAFFSKLRSDGAIVIETVKGRVAILPEIWEEFKSRLGDVATVNENEIRKRFGDELFKLFRFLREAGEIYFDTAQSMWRFIESEKQREVSESNIDLDLDALAEYHESLNE